MIYAHPEVVARVLRDGHGFRTQVPRDKAAELLGRYGLALPAGDGPVPLAVVARLLAEHWRTL